MFPTVSIHHLCTALPDTVLHQSPYTHSPLAGRRTTNNPALDPRGKQEADPVEMDPTSDNPALSGDTNTCPRKNTFRDRIVALLTCPESNQTKNCSWREKRSYTATPREYPFNFLFLVSIFYCNLSLQNTYRTVILLAWLKFRIFEQIGTFLVDEQFLKYIIA